MQILAALKQEERKHQLNVMTSALDMLKLAQISSGLPWQVFLGTDLATTPLNAYLQAYSAASGRQLSSNEAQQLVNQLHEFNADQNNWSAQTQAEFLLSRSLWSEEGYNKPPSSTSESAEGRASTESATEPAVNTYGLPYKGTGLQGGTGAYATAGAGYQNAANILANLYGNTLQTGGQLSQPYYYTPQYAKNPGVLDWISGLGQLGMGAASVAKLL